MTREYEIWENGGAELFVGKNYHYYKNQWDKRIPDQTFVSWNWPAFFVPVYWLAYRRMYLEAFLCFIASLVLTCTVAGIIVPHIIMGLLGNYIYLRRGLRVIRNTSHMTEYDAKMYIMKHGGASTTSVIFLILMVLFLGFARFIGSLGNLENQGEILLQDQQVPFSQLRLADDRTDRESRRESKCRIYTHYLKETGF